MKQNTIKMFVIALTLISLSFSVQLSLLHKTTCLQYEITSIQHKVLFSYHLNPHLDEVNMILYDKQTNIINQTGSDMNYHSFLQVQFNETGLYPICFDKISQRTATIQFDILDQEQKMVTAGKEDINRLSRKISEFLIQIRKTGWEFKQILEQHNRIKSMLSENQEKNYWIFASKLIVMGLLLLIQFYAVKYFYQ